MLEKISIVDKVEVVENGTVQVRTATRIVEDGNVISTSYHRSTISPGQDYSQEDARVQAICAATHTPEVHGYQLLSLRGKQILNCITPPERNPPTQMLV